MRLALTTNARLYKNTKGEYFTPSVYDYTFFLRYLDVFEEVKLIAHVENVADSKVVNMVRVDGPRLMVEDIPFPHGKIQYIKLYRAIGKALSKAYQDCDAAILRIPDQLAFQLYKKIKNKIPVAVEITSDPWMLFSAKNYKKSIFRPFIRWHWHLQQKKVCKNAIGTAYVTKEYLQKRYPPTHKRNGYTTFYTDTDIDDTWLKATNKLQKKEVITLIHVATSIAGNAKGHRELLIVAGELKQKGYPIRVVLVGEGELNKENTLIVKDYNIRPYIYQTGSLTRKILKEQLLQADIFVFPSYVEGLPRVLIEAMALGLPCVATALPGNRELLQDDWLVPIKDVKYLQEKVEELLNDEFLRKKVGENNRLAAGEYSIDKVEKRRKEFYLKLKQLAK